MLGLVWIHDDTLRCLPPAERTPTRLTAVLAILPNGAEIEPHGSGGGYHGTDRVTPEEAAQHGLPARGANRNLLEHVQGAEDTAFRGATPTRIAPSGAAGAAFWAGAGGFVYEVRDVPTWDINRALEGRVPLPDGTFGGNPARGETELAIPAGTLPQRVKQWSAVDEDRRGRLYFVQWIDNPSYGAR